MFEDDSEQQYRVVRNHEEQYSIWPVDQPVPPGWEPQDYVGVKSDCLSYIGRVWTDMRPKSLRERMDA